ncbi:MAG: hypothetical protein K2N53_07145, partial [Clostridia bacterium]|nr:hypothetical protein [Clostridia bacterium]
LKIEARCFSENLTFRLNEKKYGGCTYKCLDASGQYYIHIDTPSKKCEVALNISVEKSYTYSDEELTSVYKEIVHSMIDNIITYDEIAARGGVLW